MSEVTEAQITSREIARWGVDRIAAFKRDHPMDYAAVVRGESVSAPAPDPTESGPPSPEGSAGQGVTTPESQPPDTETPSDDTYATAKSPQGADLIEAVVKVIEAEGIAGFDELETDVATARDLDSQEVEELGTLLREAGREDLATALEEQATPPKPPEPGPEPTTIEQAAGTEAVVDEPLEVPDPTPESWALMRPFADQIANPALPAHERVELWEGLQPLDRAELERWFGVSVYDVPPDRDLTDDVKQAQEAEFDSTGRDPDTKRMVRETDAVMAAIRAGTILVTDRTFDRMTELHAVVRALPPEAPKRERSLGELSFLADQAQRLGPSIAPTKLRTHVFRSESVDSRGRIVIEENGQRRVLTRAETKDAYEQAEARAKAGAGTGTRDAAVVEAIRLADSYKLEQAYDLLRGMTPAQTREFWQSVRPEDKEWFNQRAGDDLNARRTR